MTWEFISNPLFMECMNRIAAGEQMCDKPMAFQTRAARFAFIPTVETTMEAKHAYVSTKLRAHFISPVKVSLSNRMRMLEQAILKKRLPVLRFLQLFSQARWLKLLPAHLGFEGHPNLVEARRLSSWTRRAVCVGIIYHCDSESMFRSERQAMKRHESAQGKAKRAADKLVSRLSSDEVSLKTIKARSIIDHLSGVVAPGQILSAPRSMLEVENLDSKLAEPASKRARFDEHAEDVDLADCVGIDEDEAASDKRTFFHVVLYNSSSKKK